MDPRGIIRKLSSVAAESCNYARLVARPRFELEERRICAVRLEDRILFNASPLASALVSHPDPASAIEPHETPTNVSDASVGSYFLGDHTSSESVQSDLTSVQPDLSTTFGGDSQEHLSRELIIIDTSVEEYDQLLGDIARRQNTLRQFDIVLLDVDRDGVEQITEILQSHRRLDALHIVSHGSHGRVQLGNSTLSAGSIEAYADLITAWNDSLKSGADLLFYGCNLAQHDSGKALVDAVGILCDCDVAASVDDTGHRYFGGDWELEYSSGAIETHVAFSEQLQQEWMQLLNVTVDSSSSGSTPDQDRVIISHTTSGANRLMLVSVATDPHGELASSVTYNGVNLTRIGLKRQQGLTHGQRSGGLIAPDVGTFDVVVTMTGTGHRGVVAGVMTFNGVNQTTPFYGYSGATGTSTSASVTTTSDADDMVFAAVHSQHTPAATPGPSQTEYWNLTDDQSNSSGTTQTGVGSVTSTWTTDNEDWTAVSVNVQADTNNVVGL